MQICSTSLEQVHSLPEIERSAGKAFLTIPEFAWIADDEVMSIAEHQRFVGLGTSWVAVVDSQSLGFVCAERFGAELHIWELAVRGDAQGQGIGAALMRRVIAEAAELGVASVTLTTFREVAFNAPFYERLGFERLAFEVAGAQGEGGVEHAQNTRLREVLAAEAAHGLPAESRCAMRLVV